MARKKSHRHKRRNVVDFRIRPKYAFVAVFAILLIFLINPLPAQVTLDNVYRKVSHTVFHEESEYVADAYVADILAQEGSFNETFASAAVFENDKVSKQPTLPSSFVATVLPTEQKKSPDKVLSAMDDSKWIEVDLSDQKLYAWENGNKVFDFTISSGKPWTPTVTGDFRIWIKLRYASMKGGSRERGDYYFLPNVPFVMYFHKGYGLHGTYWHSNFGQQMSHGCVNMKTEDAGMLFNWVGPNLDGKSAAKASAENPGTRVVVHE